MGKNQAGFSYWLAIKSPCHDKGKKIMTRQKEIYQAIQGRIFKIVFTKNNGDTREAYGQLFFDDRLVDDHPDTIAFIDFSIAAEKFGTRLDDDGNPVMNNFRRAKLDKPFTIRCGDLVIKG